MVQIFADLTHRTLTTPLAWPRDRTNNVIPPYSGSKCLAYGDIAAPSSLRSPSLRSHHKEEMPYRDHLVEFLKNNGQNRLQPASYYRAQARNLDGRPRRALHEESLHHHNQASIL